MLRDMRVHDKRWQAEKILCATESYEAMLLLLAVAADDMAMIREMARYICLRHCYAMLLLSLRHYMLPPRYIRHRHRRHSAREDAVDAIYCLRATVTSYTLLR